MGGGLQVAAWEYEMEPGWFGKVNQVGLVGLVGLEL